MSDNLVKSLREKTEEADLDTILKTTLGGYTRKSVREYISILRRQQYDSSSPFPKSCSCARPNGNGWPGSWKKAKIRLPPSRRRWSRQSP